MEILGGISKCVKRGTAHTGSCQSRWPIGLQSKGVNSSTGKRKKTLTLGGSTWGEIADLSQKKHTCSDLKTLKREQPGL